MIYECNNLRLFYTLTIILRSVMANTVISWCIFHYQKGISSSSLLMPWKNADYCPQIDTTVLAVCGMLRRPLYCIIWAWLLHPTNESSSFCFWLFMPPKLSFVSWHWTFSRHLFGVLIHIFSSGVRRTIGLWIVDCCVLFSFFWLHHQLENAFHLLFTGFDGILGGCRLSAASCRLAAVSSAT